MKVAVTGGRNYWDRAHLREYLDLFHSRTPITLLMHGGASGADRLAMTWARFKRIPVQVFEADWEMYGPAAGPLRNTKMLQEGNPEALIAFPGGLGTANCVKEAKRLGVPVYDARFTTTPGGKPATSPGLARL